MSTLLERLAAAREQAKAQITPNKTENVPKRNENIFIKYPTYDEFRKAYLLEMHQNQKDQTRPSDNSRPETPMKATIVTPARIQTKNIQVESESVKENKPLDEPVVLHEKNIGQNLKACNNKENLDSNVNPGRALLESARKYSDKIKETPKPQKSHKEEDDEKNSPEAFYGCDTVDESSPIKAIATLHDPLEDALQEDPVASHFDEKKTLDFSNDFYTKPEQEAIPSPVEEHAVSEKESERANKMFLDFKKLRREAAEKVKAFKKQISTNDVSLSPSPSKLTRNESNYISNFESTEREILDINERIEMRAHDREETSELVAAMPTKHKDLLCGLIDGYIVRYRMNSKPAKELRKHITDLYELTDELLRKQQGDQEGMENKSNMHKQLLSEISLKKDEYVDLLECGPSDDMNESCLTEGGSFCNSKSYLKRKSKKVVPAKAPDWSKVQPKTQTRRDSLGVGNLSATDTSNSRRHSLMKNTSMVEHRTLRAKPETPSSRRESLISARQSERLTNAKGTAVASQKMRRESLGYRAQESLRPPVPHNEKHRGDESKRVPSSRRESMGGPSAQAVKHSSKTVSSTRRTTQDERSTSTSRIQPPSTTSRRLSGMGIKNTMIPRPNESKMMRSGSIKQRV